MSERPKSYSGEAAENLYQECVSLLRRVKRKSYAAKRLTAIRDSIRMSLNYKTSNTGEVPSRLQGTHEDM